MFYTAAFPSLLNAVPPPAVVVAPSIALSPTNPGDLGVAPQSWAVDVTATGGLTQVKWMVGIDGAKTVTYARGQSVKTVQSYNHGDTIDFTGFGSSVLISKSTSAANAFFVSGSNGSDTVTIPGETRVSDIRYTLDGAGGTGPLGYTLVNLTSGKASIQVTFNRPGDALVVKSVDETRKAVSGAVTFNGTVTPRITLSPHGPGDLGAAPASWTTRVNTVGLDQVHWIVLDANWVGSGTTEFTSVQIVNNTATITCNLLKPGDHLVVKNLDNTVEDVSDGVIFSAGTKTLTLSSSSPGNLGTVPPGTWTTNVTTNGLSQFKWAVLDASNNLVGQWTVVNVATSNTTPITVTFTATGQKVTVRSIDEALQQTTSAATFGSVAVPATDIDFVRAWVQPLTMGCNMERDTMMGKDTAYWTRLKNDGHITHVRSFMGTKKDWGWFDNNKINQYLDGIAACIAAGFKVQFGFMDVVGESDINDGGSEDLVNRAATLISQRNFDARYFTCNPWNELAASTNSFANYWRERWVGIIRNKIGGQYIISNSASQWGDLFRMAEGTLSILNDKRVLYEWHLYPWTSTDQGEVDNAGNTINNWCKNNNVVGINGEWAQNGRDDGSGLTSSWYPLNIPVAARSPVAKQRINWWTLTNGGWYRMNQGSGYDSFDLIPDISNALRNADSTIRSQAWFSQANPY